MNEPQQVLSASHVRKRGLKFVVLGGGLFVLVVVLLIWLSSQAHRVLFPIVGAALPLAMALIGSVELITGAPFHRLNDSWMHLRGWQRGVLGTLIVLISLAIIMCLGTLIGIMLT